MPAYRIRIKAKAPPRALDRFTWTPEEADEIFSHPIAQKSNPNHAPAGTPEGGQFTSGDGGGGDAMTVTDRLGNSAVVNKYSSLGQHAVLGPDGTYHLDPQRELLHQQIVNKFLDGVPRQDGAMTLYMTGGGPASGKSSVLMGTGENLPTTVTPASMLDKPSDVADRQAVMDAGGPQAVLVDPDAIKGQIPEYVTMLKAKDSSAAAFSHEESSMIRKRLEAAAIAGNYNVLLDTTGDSSVEKLAKDTGKYADSGYKINALYATNDVDLAIKLAAARGDKTGRYVPELMLRNTHANVSDTLPKAMERKMFDSVKLYDTNVLGNARLVASGDRNGYKVADKALWNTFLDKANSGYGDKDTKTKAADGRVETDRAEAIMTAILCGTKKASFPMDAAETKFWVALAKELKDGPPTGGVWDVGNEWAGPDLTNMYSDKGVQAAKADAPGTILNRQWVTIKRTDDEKQIVYGEVYAPWVLDTYGEFMTPDDIEMMAHRFMKLDLNNVIDTQHDNLPNGSYPVESFVAREGDPEYTPGAWVLGVKIPSDSLWLAVKNGQLNGFSFQCLVKPTSVDVEVDAIRDFVGETEVSEDHSHTFFVELDDIGNVIGGRTSKAADGHTHDILRASTTDRTDGHIHRFFL